MFFEKADIKVLSLGKTEKISLQFWQHNFNNFLAKNLGIAIPDLGFSMQKLLKLLKPANCLVIFLIQ